MCDLLPGTSTNNLVPRASERHQSSQHNDFQFSQLVGDEGKSQKEKEEGFDLRKRRAEPEFGSREKAELDGKKLSSLASKHPYWCGFSVWTTRRILNTLFWRLPRAQETVRMYSQVTASMSPELEKLGYNSGRLPTGFGILEVFSELWKPEFPYL